MRSVGLGTPRRALTPGAHGGRRPGPGVAIRIGDCGFQPFDRPFRRRLAASWRSLRARFWGPGRRRDDFGAPAPNEPDGGATDVGSGACASNSPGPCEGEAPAGGPGGAVGGASGLSAAASPSRPGTPIARPCGSASARSGSCRCGAAPFSCLIVERTDRSICISRSGTSRAPRASRRPSPPRSSACRVSSGSAPACPASRSRSRFDATARADLGDPAASALVGRQRGARPAMRGERLRRGPPGGARPSPGPRSSAGRPCRIHHPGRGGTSRSRPAGPAAGASPASDQERIRRSIPEAWPPRSAGAAVGCSWAKARAVVDAAARRSASWA